MNDKPKLPTTFGDHEKEYYLDLIAKGQLKNQAARNVGFHPSIIRDAENSDEQFKEALMFAQEEHSEIIERTLLDRAINGVVKGVFFQGERCNEEVIYDNKLLITALKANNPEKYGAKKEITGKDGGAIEFTFKGFGAPELPDEIPQKVIDKIMDADFTEEDDDEDE